MTPYFKKMIKQFIKLYMIVIVLFLIISNPLSGEDTTSIVQEGFVRVTGGEIWYQVVGNGQGTPLLLIHGGPGGYSCWYAPFKVLGNERPVIFYDQLGCGYSDHPTDTTLWNLSRFVDEIDSLRKSLNLSQLMILGHSWGGAVAVEYMLTKKPVGIRALILAGPLVSTPRWMQDTKILRAQLPVSIQQVLLKHESNGTTDSEEYAAATDSFYARFLYHKDWPPQRPDECQGLTLNRQLYLFMWGSSEFYMTGTLSSFDRSNRLGELDLPVLFIGGEYDEVLPSTLYDFQNSVPGSCVEIIKDAGHMAMIEKPDEYILVLRDFLNKYDSN